MEEVETNSSAFLVSVSCLNLMSMETLSLTIDSVELDPSSSRNDAFRFEFVAGFVIEGQLLDLPLD